MEKYYYSICAIARNEHLFIEEFVNFNRATGCEHFYLYDNDSDIPLKETLKKYIDAGIVDVIDFPGRIRQVESYVHCLRNFGHQTRWLGVYDCDEFLVPKISDDAKDILRGFEGHGGLGVSWRVYGSNGHKTRPDGYIVENYTKATPLEMGDNTHIKSIVQPRYAVTTNGNPHCFTYNQGKKCVSENYQYIENAWTPNSVNKLQLNHYFTKSLQDFKEIKSARPRADTNEYRILEEFYRFDNASTHEDTCALRFVEKMKKLYL